MSTTTHSVFLSSCICLESSQLAGFVIDGRNPSLPALLEGRIHFRIELLLLVELRRLVGLFAPSDGDVYTTGD